MDALDWGVYWKDDLPIQLAHIYTGITRVTDHSQLLLRIGHLPVDDAGRKERLCAILNANLPARKQLLEQIQLRNVVKLTGQDMEE